MIRFLPHFFSAMLVVPSLTLLLSVRPAQSAAAKAHYEGRTITVSGRIASYRGRAEITLRDPSQISPR